MPEDMGTDEINPLCRIAKALERIADNLDVITHPPVMIPSALRDALPGEVTYVPA